MGGTPILPTWCSGDSPPPLFLLSSKLRPGSEDHHLVILARLRRLAALAPCTSRHSGRKRSVGTSSSLASSGGSTSSTSPIQQHYSHTPTSLVPCEPVCPASSPSRKPLSRPHAPVARQENKIASVFQHTPLEHEEELDYIFAKMELVNVGPTEDGGHEGGRAGVPTEYLNSDTEDDSDDDLHIQQPTPTQPMRTTSMASEATGKRHSSDHVVSSANFWEGLKIFYQDISASKKQRQTTTASKSEDDVEYETFMRELLDAELSPKSDEYFMASEVLLDVSVGVLTVPCLILKQRSNGSKKLILV